MRSYGDCTKVIKWALSRRADVRNPGELELALVQLRSMEGAITVRWTFGAIRSHRRPLDALQALRPVTGAYTGIKGLLLLPEVLLGGSVSRGETSVDGHSDVVSLGSDVVVRHSGVPQDQVTGAGVDLFKLVTSLFQPSETRVLVPVPLVGPLPDPLFISESVVVLLRDLVTAPHDDETTIVRAILVQVDETLETTETGSLRILVLMSPPFVRRRVLAVGPLDVYNIERDDEVVGIVDPARQKAKVGPWRIDEGELGNLLLEGSNDPGFASNLPNPVLVTDTVVHDHCCYRRRHDSAAESRSDPALHDQTYCPSPR